MTMSETLPVSTADGASSPRWMRTVRSDLRDSAAAGRALAAEAFAGPDPLLVMVLCAHTYDVTALLGPLRERLPHGAVMVGCSTNGQFSSSDDHEQAVEEGVVVVAIGGDGLEVVCRMSTDVTADRRGSGAAAADVMDDLTLEHRVCVLLADGLTRQQHEIVRGSYGVLGAGVPLVGGCAGDGLRYERTHQFLATAHTLEVVSDGLVAVGIASEGCIGIGIEHGWHKVGEPFLVTRSAGGQVFELDNRPAVDVYLDAIGQDRSVLATRDAFREAAFRHPIGLSRRSGEDIRVVHAADAADGSLSCLADVPQGAMAWLMQTTSHDLVEAARRSVAEAVDSLGGHPAAGVLVFDCGAREGMLGPDGVRDELAVLFETGAPLAGFYTYGEIGRVQGSRGMHHLTLVSLALA